MERRTLLTACACVIAGLAGCTGQGSRGPGGDGTPTGSPSPTPTSSPEPVVTDTAFTVRNTACGTGESAATVDRDDGTVTVDGTATGNNGCYTADLQSARVEDDELEVAVRTHEEGASDTACTQCIVDIDYVAEVEYEGSLERVVVTHDGDVVAERDY